MPRALKRHRPRLWIRVLVAVVAAGTLLGGWWAASVVGELDRQLVEKFAGRRWDIPSRIYTDSYLVYAGSDVPADLLLERLALLNYRRVGEIRHPGEFHYDPEGGRIDVFLRDFEYPNRSTRAFPARLHLAAGGVSGIERLDGQGTIESIELEPEIVAGIYEKVWEVRRVVHLRELPAALVRAVLAAEDRRFFEHHGIDVRGVLRALRANLRSGRVVQGGSTLTQQLIKNFFLTEARTVRRKVVEAIMALLAERRFTKLEILETYLNEIYLGQRGPKGIYGVWEGARFYFGKDPRDLSIAESAMLAGLVKAPGIYSPTRNPERALRRRNEVLAALRARGEIGAAEYEEAIREPLPDRLPTVEGSEAPYFVDFVRGELEGRHPEDVLTSQGYRIFTSLDAVLQSAAEAAVRGGLAELEKRHPRLVRHGEEPVQAALIAVEPHTGEIRAMVGGRAYKTSQFNRVTQARRQPGSIFKPIVFLAAFEEEERRGAREYLPTRRLQDEPFAWRYDGVTWQPKNYRGLYHGEVSLRDTLELSLNSATARLAAEIGIGRVRDIAIRLGFSERLALLPSLVLGSVEVTPFEVAEAFSAIANLGFRPEVASIRTVLDGDGQALARNPMRAEQVVSPRVAYLVTNLMQGAVDRGTGRAVRAAGVDIPLAGKTGTTNEGRDAWFVGFTSDLLAVVWVGFDREAPLGLSGAEAALPIWIDFMKSATRGRPPAPFLVPPGIQKATIDPASGQLATAQCPETLEESFLEGGAPIDFCRLHPGPGVEAAAVVATPSPPLLAPAAAPTPQSSWWFWE